ncbi:hypothetical protein C8A01DRAFT_20702 [Parachaetomium inaequale]|uniref:Histidine-specific methyltransferase SAM-dependent domain-containing protein n=1 Tax=Parachaetomium inaequale TaxID=2588326 RepID=A0AAN6P8A3_9PEZI|nr:hypothetical protein C8A01DRAFT_20702 [Parachaetomium inaequale]
MGTDNAQILDIGGSRLNESLRDMLVSRMLTPGNQCVLPSALLSDDNGSVLWQQINRLPDYYQTREEISLLEAHGNDIADLIAPNTVLVDIGCGVDHFKLTFPSDTRKIFPLLSLLDQSQKSIQYYGLDLSLEALRSNISKLAASFKHVQCHGLWGTFDDARRYAPTLSPASSPRWFLSLGSILGNDFPMPAVGILRSWRDCADARGRG